MSGVAKRYNHTTSQWEPVTGKYDGPSITSPRVFSSTGGDITPNVSLYDHYVFNMASNDIGILNPIGNPYDGQKITFRIKDGGISAIVNWDTKFRKVGVTIPEMMDQYDLLYVGAIYNAYDDKWDIVAASILEV